MVRTVLLDAVDRARHVEIVRAQHLDVIEEGAQHRGAGGFAELDLSA